MKGKLAAAAAGIALATGNPAQAQEVPSEEIKVGIIDIQANELTFHDGKTSIEYREYAEEGKSSANWVTESGFDHGQMMASAFVRQTRAIDENSPIRILAANVFQENSNPTGSALYSRNSHRGSKRTLSVNWEGAKEALSWFSQNDVKVVLTAFNGNDSNAMREFVQESERLGMVVFASSGNKAGGPTYPAQYPQTIAVAGDNRDLAYANDPSQSQWVEFTMNGGVPKKLEGRDIDAGSSFASAKAAAFGAYYVAHNPESDRAAVMGALGRVATPTAYEVNGHQVTTPRIDERESATRMVSVTFEDRQARISASQDRASPANAAPTRTAQQAAFLQAAMGQSR